MYSKITVLLIGMFMATSVMAAKILSKSISVSENNDVFTTRVNAVLQGDYNRYVDRMLDLRNFPKMGVPFIQEARIVRGGPANRVAWTHIYTWPVRSKFYTRTKTNRGAKKTTISYNLIPKSGPYPSDHTNLILRGNTTVQVISGKGKNTRFKVTSRSLTKLKPGTISVDFIMKRKLREQADGSIRAFAN